MDSGAALALPGLRADDELSAQLSAALAPFSFGKLKTALAWVIQGVLVRRLEAGDSWAAVVAGGSAQGLPAPRTMQRWMGAFKGQAAAWLLAVLGELARQERGSRWLAPRGPTAGSAAQSLLLASLDLRSWAKSHWPELANYGVSQRLAFLSHWGSGRGLGRLV